VWELLQDKEVARIEQGASVDVGDVIALDAVI
jgi:hypothetical protein